jgi:single-stranded-DNA-specific exonuclease
MLATARGQRWRVREAPDLGELTNAQYPPLIARLLALRGHRTIDSAQAFLHGDRTGPPPDALPGMDRLIERVFEAIKRGERIAVYGDYDVDGVTATAILSEGLRDLGGDAVTYVPNRFNEGYGLSRAGLRAVRDLGANVVISVDCGINANSEIDYAAELGMDVIVLDHHEPPSELPHAAAIVDPKLGGGPPDFDGLASCGLAYTTVRALCAAAGRSVDATRYLDLAALGTVADMVPLTGENRRIVHDGLRALQASKRPGIRALLFAAGLDARSLDAGDLGFRLAPRINAAGRLEDASLALELLTTSDPHRAGELAGALSDLNTRRQAITENALRLARGLTSEECAGQSLIMVGHKDIPRGIVGLVAGKLVEEQYRPAVVYERGDELCHGSVRSIPEFDVVDCLYQGRELMERWGGHAQAGGFTVRTDRVDRLRGVLTEWANRQLADLDPRPTLDIDLETPLGAVRGPEIKWLQYFEPCGQENPSPVLVSRRVAVTDSRPVGSTKKHLRLKLRDGVATWPAMAFDMGHASPRPGQRIDVVYSIARDRGGMGMQLHVKDFAPAE